MLERAGHATLLLDAHMFGLSIADIAAELRSFKPDMVVVTTAPTYLFWRCAPPELRIPQQLAFALRDAAPMLVAVGPHGSTTPRAALGQAAGRLRGDGRMRGDIAASGQWREERDRHLLRRRQAAIVVNGGPQAATFIDQPPLRWPDEMIRRHAHHHHRFDATPIGPGAEVEASRGCPYSCTFCAKDNFRNGYRKRPAAAILQEVDELRRQGVEYVYFIDEIFLPNAELWKGWSSRGLLFGVQTRIDLWKPEMLEMLGRAGCVSIEAGVESLTPEGRDVAGQEMPDDHRCNWPIG